MSTWRRTTSCDNCPFNPAGRGRTLRRELRRWKQILTSLRRGEVFYCHKHTRVTEEDEGPYIPTSADRVCAGAIAWQEQHGCTSNFQRVMERVDSFMARKVLRSVPETSAKNGAGVAGRRMRQKPSTRRR